MLRHTQETVDQVLKLHHEGWHIRKIENYLNVSETFISKVLREAGLTPHKCLHKNTSWLKKKSYFKKASREKDAVS